jgi:IS30 family transposase
MTKPYQHLNVTEREEINIFRAKGQSLREIAKKLGRSHTTLSRELRRNAPPIRQGYYLAHKAQLRADLRNHICHRRPRLKSPEIKRYVLKKLLKGWSPEQIAGRLDKQIPAASLSHETIYQYIYQQDRSLIPLLPRGHRIRHKRTQTHKHRNSHIPQRVPITLRPAFIQLRKQPGHWEADTVVSRASLPALHVLTERTSRLTKITKLKQKSAALSRIAINRRLSHYPHSLRRTITYDNGSENVEHVKVNATLGTKSYFCLPFHSWEKGSVENSIGLIRRFFPKKTDFDNITSAQIKRVEALLNNRPRKCLGFSTPLESFQKSGALAG